MRTIVRLLPVVLFCVSANALINIPDDYPTIQLGIDAAVNGDTVLIAPGTYIEALEIQDLNITLASHFLMTEDTTFIPTTIIDGDSTLQLLNCIGPENIHLTGLTFQRGVSLELGGGLYVSGGINTQENVDLQISNCRFREFSGSRSSVMLLNSRNLAVENCVFEDNQVEDYKLINMWYMDNVSFRRVVFRNNYNCPGLIGAGLDSTYTIDSCQFIGNDCNTIGISSFISGGGAFAEITNCQFLENSGLGLNSLLTLGSDSLLIENCIFDSNTLHEPNGHAIVHVGAAEGITLKNIRITYNSLFDSYLLAPGIEAHGGRVFADSIFIQNNYSDYDESGSGLKVCYLYGGGTADYDTSYISNVFIENNEYRRTDMDSPGAGPSNSKLGLTVRYNVIVDNLVVANNLNDASHNGLGVFVYGTYNRTAEFHNVLIHDNHWTYQMDGSNGASAFDHTSVVNGKVLFDSVTVYSQYNVGTSVARVLADTLVIKNSRFYDCGHGALHLAGENIYVTNSQIDDCFDLIYHEFFHAYPKVFSIEPLISADIINCNFVDCQVDHGPTIRLYSDEDPNPIPRISFLNCIVENTYEDWPSLEINGDDVVNLGVRYSDINGGWYGEGNIDLDPIFVDRENDDYSLQPESPCIDAGISDVRFNDPEDPANPGFALWPAMGTLRNDMGVYGGSGEYPSYEGVPNVGAAPRGCPDAVTLSCNYPNPFNPTTTIEFTLPYPQDIQLTVFNILGQHIDVLARGCYSAGVHQVQFDGTKLTSGVYVCRLAVGEYVNSRKMLLIR
jgi:hypothetical protein